MMMRLKRVRATAFALALVFFAGVTPHALATVFEYNGEIFFCTTTCDSFGALGGQTGGSGNTINSVVVGSLDIPVQPDGTFSFLASDNVPFNFTITTSAIPFEAPVIGPVMGCPPPNAVGQVCNPTTVNPLPLDGTVATIAGSGLVGTDGQFVSGTLIFTFTVPPFSNNGAVVTFDLSDSSAFGTVFGGAVVFTRISGAFMAAPPVIAVGQPMPDPFPNTLVGDTSSSTVTVTNTGLNPATVTLDTSALVAPFSITADTCSVAQVAANGGTCTITAEFAPVAEGMATGTFSVLSDDPLASNVAVTLVGNGIIPEIDAQPNPLAFADTIVGATATLDVTVSNLGSAPLIIPVDGVTAPAAPFSITADTCTNVSVPAAGTCVITVQFAPDAAGAATGSFDILSNDPNEATVTVSLTGAGAEPNIVITPSNLAFPSLVTGQVQTRTVTVSNTGSADLVIGMIAATDFIAPFSLTADTCSTQTLAPAATCTLSVQFAPTADGMFTNGYSIPSNDRDEPVAQASLSGTATAAPEPFITVDPTSLGFGDVIVSQMNMNTLSIVNDGSADLTISSIVVGGADAGDFTQTNDCTVVTPAASCTVTVTFTPAAVGSRIATLTVNSDAANDTAVVIGLTGTGLLGPQISVESSTLTIGSNLAIEIGQSGTGSFTVVSAGSSDLLISSAALTGADAGQFTVNAAPCTGAPLPPMQSCLVTVTFSPTTAGDKSATLTIASNDVDEPEVTVAITGLVFAGSRPELSVAEVQIGTSTAPVQVGQTGTSEIVIMSTGSDDLSVVSVVLGGPDAAEFTLEEDCTAMDLPRGTECTIGLGFTPTTPGTKTAEIQITTQDAVVSRSSHQTTVVVPITATAVAPPPPPPPPAGSQTNIPPAFATTGESAPGACFIATAAFGSYLDPNVKVLRDFRDAVLLRTDLGRSFVKLYYSNSPIVADFIARHEGARTATRLALTPMVYALAYPVPTLLVLLGAWAMLLKRRRRFD